MAAKGRFKIQWYGNEVLAEIAAMTADEEKAAAERVLKRARKKVPVGKKIVATPFGGKAYQSRYPGRLRASLRIERSKFKDGGWLVYAGSELAYYARFVEYGTIFMRMRKGYKYMRGALALEKAYFTRRLRKKLGV